jgi:hypothetical protein
MVCVSGGQLSSFLTRLMAYRMPKPIAADRSHHGQNGARNAKVSRVTHEAAQVRIHHLFQFAGGFAWNPSSPISPSSVLDNVSG